MSTSNGWPPEELRRARSHIVRLQRRQAARRARERALKGSQDAYRMLRRKTDPLTKEGTRYGG